MGLRELASTLLKPVALLSNQRLVSMMPTDVLLDTVIHHWKHPFEL